MGIDISKIKNEMLQIIAKGVNIMDDDEKTLNETEVSLFRYKAGKLLENKMITEEELNQALVEMGLAVEKKPTVTEVKSEETVEENKQDVKSNNAPVEKPKSDNLVPDKGPEKIARIDAKQVKTSNQQRAITTAALEKEFMGNIVGDDFKATRDALLQKYPAGSPYHNAALVAADMLDTISVIWETSTKDKAAIEQLKNNVKKSMGDLTKTQKAILESIVKTAEAKQRIKEIDEIDKAFDTFKNDQKVQADINAGKYAEVMKQFEAKLGDKLNKSYYREEFEKFKNIAFKDEIDANFGNAVSKADGKTAKEIRQSLLASATDEITRKNYENRPTNIDYDVEANKRSVENRRKELNSENVKEELGVGDENKITVYKHFDKLVETAFSTSTQYGINRPKAKELCAKLDECLSKPGIDFNMQEMSDIIGKYAGKDYEVNGSEQGETEELKNIADALNRVYNPSIPFDKEDAKLLAHFCGYKVTTRKFGGKELIEHIAHDAAGSVVAGSGAYIASKHALLAFIKDMTPEVENDVINKFDAVVQQLVRSGRITAEQAAEFHKTQIVKIITNKEELMKACKNPEEYAKIAGIQAGLLPLAVSAIEIVLKEFIIGDSIQFEDAVSAETNAYENTDEFKYIDKYRERLNRKFANNPNMAKFLGGIAEKHVVNGNLNWADYATELNLIAGPGSVMNRKEAAGAMNYSAQTKPNEEPVAVVKRNITKTVDGKVATDEEVKEAEKHNETEQTKADKPIVTTTPYKVQTGDLWQSFADFYPGLLEKYMGKQDQKLPEAERERRARNELRLVIIKAMANDNIDTIKALRNSSLAGTYEFPNEIEGFALDTSKFNDHKKYEYTRSSNKDTTKATMDKPKETAQPKTKPYEPKLKQIGADTTYVARDKDLAIKGTGRGKQEEQALQNLEEQNKRRYDRSKVERENYEK